MTLQPATVRWPDISSAFSVEEDTNGKAPIPVYLIGKPADQALSELDLTAAQKAWVETARFKASAGTVLSLPGSDGRVSAVLVGIGSGDSGVPCGPGVFLAGKVAKSAPSGTYAFPTLSDEDQSNAALAFGLGAYSFKRYQSEDDKLKSDADPRLRVSKSTLQEIAGQVEAVWFARDLINTPANDLGPAQLQAAAERLAERHGAAIETTVGEQLLERNFPMIHAVGRASTQAPRLIDLRWRADGADAEAPKVSLVGKGICFDTGGLDIKPAAGMLLMKKDMGGAATTLALAHMIMASNLPVNLRVLIPAAENSIASDAFRPGDILTSRCGKTVEIGNTDAEGRLVLADAVSYADEESPDHLITLATLTGAARVALGPDLPAFFSTDDDFADRALSEGLTAADPLWRMPFWDNYDKRLKSQVADVSNISDGPFAGAITAALFLKRFVSNASAYAHVDLYGWRSAAAPLGPKGGEPGGARALFAALNSLYAPK